MKYITDENGVTFSSPQRPDGSLITLTGATRQHCSSLNITTRLIEERLHDGWEEEDATTFSPNYVMHNGRIHYFYNRRGKEIYISLEDMKKADLELALDAKTIAVRLGKGYTAEEALTRPIDRRYVSSYQLLGDTFNTWKALEAKRAREAVKELRESKLKEEKPHLFDGTKQQHSRGAWCEYLMENDIFPKVAK
ncbi:hypothetical protein [Staphylococcus shinii]|uniref:hypothetical protein n=1 Tax=Staphylococcus shinii TaxID=2912228 RepID=UPI003D804E3E